MVTYQDLLAVGDSDEKKMEFVRSTINWYQGTEFYKTAKVAREYMKKKNPDIAQYTKMLYTVTGRQIPDTYSSSFKIGRAFFPFFVTQEAQYLLSNGVTWENPETADRLGTKKAQFDTVLQDIASDSLEAGCGYGFWNLDHVDVFTVLEYIPLEDEENGAMRAGIRYWQIDSNKPFRATLYEEDGYTEYIWNRTQENGQTKDSGEVMAPKRPYKISIKGAAVDEKKIYIGENYPTFPIVPLWGNKEHQSELVGLREKNFAYDMIASGFCDTVQDASYIFWAIHNAPGMGDEDLAKFLQRIHQLHIAHTEDGASSAEPQQLETPYQSREAVLKMLKDDIYADAKAFDPDDVKSGAVVTAQIRSAYTMLDMKVNDFEYEVRKFIESIMELAGVDDKPTFTRSVIINQTEEIQAVLQAQTALDDEYVTKKVMTILGDGDQAEEVIRRRIADEVTMQRNIIPEEPKQGGDVSADE